MAIMNNKKGSTVTLTVTSNTTFLLSDVAVAGETVASMTITKIFWSTANTTTGVQITRGANNYLKLVGTDTWDFTQHPLTADPTASIVVVIPDGASSAILQVHKKSTYTSDYSSGG